jgi:hypothetical protein
MMCLPAKKSAAPDRMRHAIIDGAYHRAKPARLERERAGSTMNSNAGWFETKSNAHKWTGPEGQPRVPLNWRDHSY